MKALVITLFILLGTLAVNAQTQEPEICVPKSTIETALRMKDRMEAAEKQAADYKLAYEKLLEAVNAANIKIAELSGRLAELKASDVQKDAIIDTLIKTHKKPNKFGVINF